MNSGATFILYCFLGGILLTISIYLYFKPTKEVDEETEEILDCDKIFKKLKSSQCTRDDLYYYTDYFFKNYQTLKPNIKQNKDLLKIICLHKHTNAKIILKTQESLSNLNPNIKNQLNKIVEIRAGIR